MRKTRFIENCRCYHLISRLQHQAFFLDDNEKARRGYAFMYGNGDWETIRACHEKSMREAMGEVLAEREREKEERELVYVAEFVLFHLAFAFLKEAVV